MQIQVRRVIMSHLICIYTVCFRGYFLKTVNINKSALSILQDCFNRRSIVVVPMLVIAIPVLFGYSRKLEMYICHKVGIVGVSGILQNF